MQKSKPNPKPNVFLIGVSRPFLIKLVKPFWDSENKAIVRTLRFMECTEPESEGA